MMGSISGCGLLSDVVFNREAKVEKYSSGTVHLTSNRIIWRDSCDSKVQIALSLDLVVEVKLVVWNE